jgi:TrpR-related protein YerC/YecD
VTTGEDWRSDRTRDLFEAILRLETVDEAARFFRDLCTLGELDAMSQRWHVVRLLEAGMPYREIAETAGSSTATVTRISQWLHHGAGGYRLVLDRLGGP